MRHCFFASNFLIGVIRFVVYSLVTISLPPSSALGFSLTAESPVLEHIHSNAEVGSLKRGLPGHLGGRADSCLLAKGHASAGQAFLSGQVKGKPRAA